jgi:coenzyme F420-reducing hydrogenase delta subunit/NAD-dependent dihydropyrimidine dehydrogenase PreA subunit
MKDGAKLGVFLCACGEMIGSKLNLAELKDQLGSDPDVSHCSVHSYLCQGPGLAALTQEVQARGLNRVLLGACSDRIMKKKFAAVLKPLGIMAPQIDLINLKDHVAAVHEDSVPDLTRKAAALLAGGVGSLKMLEPYAPLLADFKGPAMILGGGISGFAAARELAHQGMESLVFSCARNPGDVLKGLRRTYPGSRIYFKDLEAMLQEVFASPLVEMAPDRPVDFVVGQVGDYRVGLQQDPHEVSEMRGSAIILALDREYAKEEGWAMGGAGRVIDQLELEDRLAKKQVKPGSMVFWVNHREEGRLVQELSAAAAWRSSQVLAQEFPEVRPIVLYPADIKLPVTGADLVAAKRSGIGLYPYNPDIHPVVKAGYLDYVNPYDHLEHEVGWDTLVVSAIPGQPGMKAQELMRVLPIFSQNGGSLKKGPMALKPDQKPVESIILTGSALKLCDLDEALQQGKNAAREVLHLRDKARKGGLASPLVVVTVDQDLCEGCGLCNEICTCGGVENVVPGKGATPRHVSPYSCDGGGSCAAACPYEAMKLLNNSSQQLEARIRAILPRMQANDALAFVCSWGGQGAAELAARQGLSYSSRLYLIPVNCLGSIDPAIFSMAFLNGANGILLAGCPPNASCHYGYGVDHTWHRVYLMKKLLGMSGLERKRIALGYVDVNQPEAFVRMADVFLDHLDNIAPLDRSADQKKKLLAVHATMHRPRVRWVLGVSLRRPSEKEFPGDQYNAVDFDETMQDVLQEEYLAARIIGALRDGPLNPPEIAQALGERTATVTPVLNELLRDNRLMRLRWEGGYPLYDLAKSA